MLLFAHNDNLISEEEFFLYELNKSRNLKLPYRSYDQFNVDLLLTMNARSGSLGKNIFLAISEVSGNHKIFSLYSLSRTKLH